jgi:hypothetical protein
VKVAAEVRSSIGPALYDVQTRGKPGAPLRLFLDSNVLTAGIVSAWGLERAV